METVRWIIDETIIDNPNTVNGTILDALIDLGYSHYVGKYQPFVEPQNYGVEYIGIPNILYGSINYVEKCKRGFIPGAYGFNRNIRCDVYYSYIPNKWLLNDDYVCVPFYKIKEAVELCEWHDVFIRPLSGHKTFTGFVATLENIEFELKSTMSLTSCYPETMCLISSAKNIYAEYRFLIGNKEIIDGSEYRWDNKLDIRHDYDMECYDLAKKMANHSWQPDTVYVCDVAQTGVGPKIIELNAFSSSGLYAMDKKKVVEKVSDIAIKDYNGWL